MKRIGAHVSASGGVQNAPINAKNIGADAFAMFVKNQRQWSAKPLDEVSIAQFEINLKEAKISPKHVLVHDSYLINLGHPDPELRKKSLDAFMDEISRVSQLGLCLLNFHPGSHLNLISEKECLNNISESINYAILNSNNVKLVIENTAGQGSNLGYNFEQISYIISKCIDKRKIGVCIDTCHAFAGGYDFRDKKSYLKTMEKFDSLIGYEFLSGMHLNDTKNDLGIKKDRHESLGKGFLGLSAFENIMNDINIDEIPLILETIDESIWADEIKLLKNLQGEMCLK